MRLSLKFLLVFLGYVMISISCAENAFADELADCFSGLRIRKQNLKRKAPVAVKNKGKPFINIKHAIDVDDIRNIIVLNSCIRRFKPDRTRDRSFSTATNAYGGGNNVTFVGGIIHDLMPDLMGHLKSLMDFGALSASWR